MDPKQKAIVAAYNEIAGRNLKALPREVRIREALKVFDVEDFRNTFLWAKHDPWCVANDILRTRPAWLCSYDTVASHSDFVEPEKEEAWV